MSLKIEEIDNYRCFVCNKPFLHRNRYSPHDKGIKLVEFVMAHAGCRHLQNQLEQLNNDVDNAMIERRGHSAEVRQLNKLIKEKKEAITTFEYNIFLKKYSM